MLLPASAIPTPAAVTGCQIIGVEITDEAKAVNTHPFRGNTAFMIGNEVMNKDNQ